MNIELAPQKGCERAPTKCVIQQRRLVVHHTKHVDTVMTSDYCPQGYIVACMK